MKEGGIEAILRHLLIQKQSKISFSLCQILLGKRFCRSKCLNLLLLKQFKWFEVILSDSWKYWDLIAYVNHNLISYVGC